VFLYTDLLLFLFAAWGEREKKEKCGKNPFPEHTKSHQSIHNKQLVG
jgi:hypothetical protein